MNLSIFQRDFIENNHRLISLTYLLISFYLNPSSTKHPTQQIITQTRFLLVILLNYGMALNPKRQNQLLNQLFHFWLFIFNKSYQQFFIAQKLQNYQCIIYLICPEINIQMQNSSQHKYPFFRNHHHKKRAKTLQATYGDVLESNPNKQSSHLIVKRRNYLKQPSNEKSIKILDFRTKKTPINPSTIPVQLDPYKKYIQEFAIPKFTTQANAQSIQQILGNSSYNNITQKQPTKNDEVQFRITQSNNYYAVKKNSLLNNKAYDQSKRTALFTRKSLYSINSMEKVKKVGANNPNNAHGYYYPADKYKSLSKNDHPKQITAGQNKSNVSPYSNILRQKQPTSYDRQELHSKKHSFSISRNRYLLTKQQPHLSTHLNPSSHHRAVARHHSNSQSVIIDKNFQKLIKKQFSSVSVKQLNNQPVIRNHLDQMYLTQYEKEQVKNYKDVYYIGHKAYLRKYKEHGNFRDQKQNYKPIIGDHIAYRFQIVRVLGSGAFGKVLEVVDHKQLSSSKKKNYALKILKKSQDLYDQFKLQVQILKTIKQNHQACKNIVQIKGDFQFRGHICIVTQLLDLNVYSFIKNQQFQGLSLEITRKIMIQILQALLFLHNKEVIHCDIKPENIVFKQEGKSGVKLIDFGSACFKDKKEFTYIQSRYYRSPEIVLVKPYDEKIDVWSTGCLAFEMFTGSPLFPARCQEEQLEMLKQTLGCPPQYFLDKCQRAEQFTFQKNQPIFPLSKRIEAAKTSPAFLDFLQKMIRWSPQERLSIRQALMHDFILQGLPEKVRKQHVNQMKSENPYGLFQEW